MAIDLGAISAIVDAGHPDTAIVGLPIGLLREIEQVLQRVHADELTARAGAKTVAVATAMIMGGAA